MRYSAYVICGTPRSGSTLLCDMLAATSVSGSPNSYFRAESLVDFCAAWGISTAIDTDDPVFINDYLAAMRHGGTAGTGVFGLRLMWPSVSLAAKMLGGQPDGSDLNEKIQTQFGPTLFIHLSRDDKIAQAVSLARAEQSGLWHRHADGSVREGPTAPSASVYDRPLIASSLAALRIEDASWDPFFAQNKIDPLIVTYEELARNPRPHLRAILARLGLDASAAARVPIGTAKLADAISQDWIDRFRADSEA